MINKQVIKWKLRPFIYAAIISVGFFSLALILEYTNGDSFFLISFILYIIILFELYTTANHYHVFHKENTNAIYEFEDHRIVQYAHHLLLPTLLYIFQVLFLFYHQEESLYFLLIFVTFGLFFILFQNIQSFYKHKFSLNKATNYIYDILSVVLVFLSSSALLEIDKNTEVKSENLFIIYVSLMMILNLLTISRHLITKLTILLAILFAISLGVIFYINTFGFVSPLLLAFISSVVAYGFIALIVNLLDGKKINKEMFLEYLILLMLLGSLVLLNVG